jgi:hypothetical protein
VRTDRSRGGPFAALLARAAEEPGAAAGLAEAYGRLDVASRRRLVDAVVSDALGEGVSPGRVLLWLLSVEEDLDVAHAIAAALVEHAGAALAPESGPSGRLAGGVQDGAALLLQPADDGRVEGLIVRWRGGTLSESEFQPDLPEGELTAWLERQPEPQWACAPVRDVVDAVTPVVWEHMRRGGTPPRGLARFAELFSVEPTE